MGGYSYSSLVIFLSLLLFCFDCDDANHVYLGHSIVKANRISPAFAALEDIMLLRSMRDQQHQQDDGNEIFLKGTKIDLVENRSKKLPAKSYEGIKIEEVAAQDIEKSPSVEIAMRGEAINVAHFTDKFISTLGKKESLRLSGFSSKWGKDPVELSAAPTAESIEEAKVFGNILGKTTKTPKRVGSSSIAKRSLGTVVSDYKKIRGTIFLKEGSIGLEDDFVYYVERNFNGVVHEVGVVDPSSPSFEIQVEKPRGVLAVELRDSKGQVLAYGEQKLSGLGDLEIPVFPADTAFVGRVLSYESYDDYEKPVAQAVQTIDGVKGRMEVDGEGYFNQGVLSRGSSFVSSAGAQNFWSSLTLGSFGKPMYPKLFSNDHVKALGSFIDPYGEDIQVTSVLSGVVTQSGLPRSGMKVKISQGEFFKPIYLENKIPKPNLVSTAGDGSFVFANLPDGAHLVQVFQNERLLAQTWYVVRAGHVSHGQVEISSQWSVELGMESFPGEVENPSVEIYELGADLNREVSQGQDEFFKLYSNPEFVVFGSQPDRRFPEHIHMFPSKSSKKKLKFVEESWLVSFLAHNRSNANRSLGMIVGFYNNADFKVVLEASSAKTSTSKVYYFDRKGNRIDSGESGGGFVITDVSSGMKTVVISSRASADFLSSLVLTAKKAVSIVSF